jgi:DNA repair exonuclease SbcCD ATPase subunit
MDPDPNAPATKADLAELKTEVKTEMAELRTELAELRTELRADIARSQREVVHSLAGEIARATNVIFERMTDQFRAGDDRTSAVADRVTVLERRVDEHVADAARHHAPRRRR